MSNASKIHVGRIVRYFAGYGGIDGVGVIVAVYGTPNLQPADNSFGPFIRVVRDADCRVDVILFDGRRLNAIDECGIDAPGIGIKLTDEVLDDVSKLEEIAAKYQADLAIAKAKERAELEAREAARVINDPPVFFWNGVKDKRGDKLQSASYSMSQLSGYPDGTITIYARGYSGFSSKVCDCFPVENNSDSMVDYFEKDRVRVLPQHPLYPAVKAAFEAQSARWSAKYGRQAA
jgi:hypothetical protein